MFSCFYVSWSLPAFFFLARFGCKTDRHIINITMFFKFFFAYRQGLYADKNALFIGLLIVEVVGPKH